MQRSFLFWYFIDCTSAVMIATRKLRAYQTFGNIVEALFCHSDWKLRICKTCTSQTLQNFRCTHCEFMELEAYQQLSNISEKFIFLY